MINPIEMSQNLSIIETTEKARHDTYTEVGLAPGQIQQWAKSSSDTVSDTGSAQQKK